MNHTNGFATLTTILITSAVLSWLVYASTFDVGVQAQGLQTAEKNLEKLMWEESCKDIVHALSLQNPQVIPVVFVNDKLCSS